MAPDSPRDATAYRRGSRAPGRRDLPEPGGVQPEAPPLLSLSPRVHGRPHPRWLWPWSSVPVLWPEAFPDVDYVRILVYNPPPPPPPPLPKGNPMRPETEKRPEPASETPQPKPDAFVAPVEVTPETPRRSPRTPSPLRINSAATPGTRPVSPREWRAESWGGRWVERWVESSGGVLGARATSPSPTSTSRPTASEGHLRSIPRRPSSRRSRESFFSRSTSIQPDGSPERECSSPYPSLDQAAIACVMQWALRSRHQGRAARCSRQPTRPSHSASIETTRRTPPPAGARANHPDDRGEIDAGRLHSRARTAARADPRQKESAPDHRGPMATSRRRTGQGTEKQIPVSNLKRRFSRAFGGCHQ